MTHKKLKTSARFTNLPQKTIGNFSCELRCGFARLRTIATPDYKTTSQRDYETFASQDYKSTRLRDNKWGGSRWGFAGITESRIDGIMELRIGRVGWGLKAQSLSIPFYTLYTLLYSLYSQLTANCSHALALRCLLSVDCCP